MPEKLDLTLTRPEKEVSTWAQTAEEISTLAEAWKGDYNKDGGCKGLRERFIANRGLRRRFHR
jgi:hypothetical protein